MQHVLDDNEFHTIKDCKFECKPILLKDELIKVKESKQQEGPGEKKKAESQGIHYNSHMHEADYSST